MNAATAVNLPNLSTGDVAQILREARYDVLAAQSTTAGLCCAGGCRIHSLLWGVIEVCGEQSGQGVEAACAQARFQ